MWVNRYDGGSYDWTYGIAVDSFGNAYVTGASYDSVTGYDYTTVKYDTNGNVQWIKKYDNSHSYDYATILAVDSVGNVYVSGWSYNSGTGWDYATVKYDTDGNEQWVKRYNGTNQDDWVSSITVDSSGNVYVTGDSGTVKYDINGNELWVKSDSANAIAVNTSGNVYVTGNSGTIKYDADGNTVWSKRYEYGYSNIAVALAVDISGNVYVTGASWETASMLADYVTVKYDTNGSELWVQKYDSGLQDWPAALVTDSSGNVYVTGASGSFDWTGNFSDYATVKYDTDGNELWIKRYDGPASYYDAPVGIVVDASANVYVAGTSEWDYLTIKYRQKLLTPAQVASIISDMLKSGAIRDKGIANALISPLNNAQAIIEANPIAAKNMIQAVINKIEALSGKKLSNEDAQKLIGYLNSIIKGL